MQKTSTLLFLIVIGLAIGQKAQAQSDYREVGTRFNSFDNFGLIYKKERAENRLTRYNLAVLNLGFTEGGRFDNYAFGAQFGMGWERRRQIENKLKFIHGFSPAIGFSSSRVTDGTVVNRQTTVSLELGYILGLQYDISESLYVNIELIPGIRASNSEQINQDFWNINLGGGTQNAAITLAYRFRKN